MGSVMGRRGELFAVRGGWLEGLGTASCCVGVDFHIASWTGDRECIFEGED